MATIAHITSGMSQAQVFDIINELIDSFNASEGAVAASLTNGRIDYDALANKPSINGVELAAGMTHSQLDIDLDAAAIQRLANVEDRVAGAETAEAQNLAELANLQTFKATYKGYVDTMRSQRASDRGDIDALQTQMDTEGDRIDLLNERYSAVHTTQTSEQTKVTTLQSQMATKAAQTDFSEVVTRLVAAVNRLNMVTHAVLQLEGSGCAGSQSITDATGGACLQDVVNTFTFDD